MEPLENAPAAVADLAESCVRFVQQSLGLPLDYSPETLPILDHYVRERARGATDSDGDEGESESKADILELLAPATGAYFGEVVRRRFEQVRWHCPADDYEAYRLEFERFFLSFNPYGIAVEVLSAGQEAASGAFFDVLDEARPLLREALAKHSRVPTEDYFTFTMRFEVLEQVAELLFALESQRKERRVFGPDVYRAARGERTGAGQPS